MTNFEVINEKMTDLWLFQVLSVFCIFCIEKFENSKKYFVNVTSEFCNVPS